MLQAELQDLSEDHNAMQKAERAVQFGFDISVSRAVEPVPVGSWLNNTELPGGDYKTVRTLS